MLANQAPTHKEHRHEGFWPSRKDEPGFPVAKTWSKAESMAFMADLDVVESHATATGAVLSMRGWSTCRLCSQPNGSREFQYGGWAWPQGFIHYIEDHLVKPSQPFIDFIVHEAADIRDRYPFGFQTP